MGGGSEKFTILKKQRQLRCDCYWFKTGSQSSHPVQSNRKSSTKIPTHSNPWLDPIHVHLWYTQLNKLKQFNISNTASCPDSTWPLTTVGQESGWAYPTSAYGSSSQYRNFYAAWRRPNEAIRSYYETFLVRPHLAVHAVCWSVCPVKINSFIHFYSDHTLQLSINQSIKNSTPINYEQVRFTI